MATNLHSATTTRKVTVHARTARKHGFYGRTIASATISVEAYGVEIDGHGFGDEAAIKVAARAALLPLVGARKFSVSIDW